MFNRFSSAPPANNLSGNISNMNSSSQQQQNSASNPFFGGGVNSSTSPFNAFGGGSAPTAMQTPSAPYAVTNELENGMTIKLLSISSMPAYRHLSQEVNHLLCLFHFIFILSC